MGMISFHYCEKLEDLPSNVDNDALYFVQNHGIYKGRVNCTSDHATINSILNILQETVATIDAELVKINSSISSLQTNISNLQTTANNKLDKANPSASGTFTLAGGSGQSVFEHSGDTLFIKL